LVTKLSTENNVSSFSAKAELSLSTTTVQLQYLPETLVTFTPPASSATADYNIAKVEGLITSNNSTNDAVIIGLCAQTEAGGTVTILAGSSFRLLKLT